MDSQIDSPPTGTGSGSSGLDSGSPPGVTRPPRSWWALTALAVVVAVIAAGTVQHFFDQRSAARDLYRMQLLTTEWRFGDEEVRQLALPAAQRSGPAFEDLASQISADGGINGYGTLQVSLGAGGILPTQADLVVTVASPYASTTVVVWYVLISGNGGVSTDQGACALSSTLLGPGRATTDVQLGGHYFVPPCTSDMWSSTTGPISPHFGAAGISQTPTG